MAISIRLPASHVLSVGGNYAFSEALGLANARAVNENWPALPSQNFADCVRSIDGSDYVFDFYPGGTSGDFSSEDNAAIVAAVTL